MPAIKRAFGSPRPHTGKLQSDQGTHVPLKYLAQLKPRNPIPIAGDTISVTITGGANAPVVFWNGNDIYELRTTLTYTWSTSNTILDATSGAVLTAQASISTGVWYFYVGITGDLDTAWAFALYPSKIPPLAVGAGEYSLGWFVHPGTGKENYWDYVGWAAITSAGDGDTIAVQQAFAKQGYWYYTAAQSGTISSTASSIPASVDFSAVLPAHGNAEVAGYLSSTTTASASVIRVQISSTAGTGGYAVQSPATAFAAIAVPPIALPTTAALYCSTGITEAATININMIKDIV